MKCPASVAMSEDQPNKSTVFAKEGTAAHEFNEFIMANGDDPTLWLGGAVDLESEGDERFVKHAGNLHIDRDRFFAIDHEMVEGCQMVIDTVERFLSRVDGDELMLETRLDMSWVHPKLFGTGDIMVYKRREKRLVVLDYKYGSGHVVEVDDNPQVLTYAIGALALFPDAEIITNVIIQPRAFHRDGPVREQTIDKFDLLEFESTLAEKAARTDDPNAAMVAGEHCKFCPAAWGCPALRALNHQTIGVKKLKPGQQMTENHLPKLSDMTPEQIGAVVREVQIIEGWLKRVLAHAHDQAMNGNMPAGCKLVEKRAYRKFNIGEDEIKEALIFEGIADEVFMKEPELRTLTQIEQAIGKKTFASLFGAKPDAEDAKWTKKSSGYVLAPIEDAREAVKLDQGDSFDAVEGED